MKTIIAIWGTADIGKSTIIRAIFNKLNVNQNFTVIIDDGDILAKGKYNNKTIGIESQGDPSSRQGDSIEKLAQLNCDIIICASRTKGATVQNILNIQQQFNYELIWTSHYSGGNQGIMPNGVSLNDEFSNNIINLINML